MGYAQVQTQVAAQLPAHPPQHLNGPRTPDQPVLHRVLNVTANELAACHSLATGLSMAIDRMFGSVQPDKILSAPEPPGGVLPASQHNEDLARGLRARLEDLTKRLEELV